jgi:hypothetical protein
MSAWHTHDHLLSWKLSPVLSWRRCYYRTHAWSSSIPCQWAIHSKFSILGKSGSLDRIDLEGSKFFTSFVVWRHLPWVQYTKIGWDPFQLSLNAWGTCQLHVTSEPSNSTSANVSKKMEIAFSLWNRWNRIIIMNELKSRQHFNAQGILIEREGSVRLTSLY